MIAAKLFAKQTLFRGAALGLFFLLNAATCEDQNANTSPSAPAAVHFAKDLKMDAAQARADVTAFTQEPHPLGSEAQTLLAQYLQRRAEELGLKVVKSEFEAETPNPTALQKSGAPTSLTIRKKGANIFARTSVPSKPTCAVLVASHYDTKDIPGIRNLGANDSASSSVILLQLLSAIKQASQKLPLTCEVIGVWFDGEESVLGEWRDGETIHPARRADHTYGSQYEADRLQKCGKEKCLPKELSGLPLKALIVLDMLGSKNLTITPDAHSHPRLTATLKATAESLFPGGLMSSNPPLPIEDDHIPFRKRGVDVLNIIDFENLTTWHQATDTPDALSYESMEKAFRLATAVTLTLAQ